jgi:hypothetical protein
MEVPEQKGKDNGGGNPNHDLDNGQFTFGPGGPRQSEPRRQLADIKPASGSKIPESGNAGKPSQALPPKASRFNIAHGTNASPAQITAEWAADATIRTRLVGSGVTPAAREQLTRFVEGISNPPDGALYPVGSAGSNEVRDSPYVRELDVWVQRAIAERNGDTIPDGKYTELGPRDKSTSPKMFETFRSAGLAEALKPFGEHVTLGDVIGSFTEKLTVTVKDGHVTYRGVNKTTVRSFAYGNISNENGVENVIENPLVGPLGTIKQVVYFRFRKRY